MDYAGPMQGKMFLIAVDAHSKWMEVAIVQSATSAATIEKAQKPIRYTWVARNVSFRQWNMLHKPGIQRVHGIQHVKTAPYHPSSNGQAERAVQVFKEGLKRSSKGSLETRIARFLFQYRTTPHTTTGVTPAELLMGQCLRSHLSMLNPDVANRVHSKQGEQKKQHDRRSKDRDLKEGDQVWVREFSSAAWIRGTLVKNQGPLSFSVTRGWTGDPTASGPHLPSGQGAPTDPDRI